MRLTLFFLGVLLTLVGIGFIFWQAAFIVAGVFVLFISINMGSDSTAPSTVRARKTSTQAQPDFNHN